MDGPCEQDKTNGISCCCKNPFPLPYKLFPFKHQKPWWTVDGNATVHFKTANANYRFEVGISLIWLKANWISPQSYTYNYPCMTLLGTFRNLALALLHLSKAKITHTTKGY